MAIDPLTAGLDLAKTVVNKIFPDKSEQERQELADALSIIQGQLSVNAAEAASSSVFVSGARPFVMWVCGFAMAYVSVIEPIARFVAAVTFHYAGQFPIIDTTLTMQVLFGILGLGGLRSVERIKGVIPPGR